MKLRKLNKIYDIDMMQEMKTIILSHLRDIEQENDVKVLLAVATGSRAWGWDSPSSDWDVRFIYVHKPEWYFKIEPQRDVIEKVTGDNVDLAGWELRKALYLLKRSNPSLLEWLNSSSVICLDEEFGRRIHEIEKDYFNPVKSMYHYNGMYNKYNERYFGGDGFPIKGFIYYLRGVLSCKWIETKLSLPPTRISDLLDATVEDQRIRSMIDDVIKIKKGLLKSDKQVVDDSLVNYARHLADHYNEIIGSFRPELNEVSADALDSILYDMVKANA